MIRYDPATRTVLMDLVNLEHCGFQVDVYWDELHLNGLDDSDPALQWPETLLVRFKEGAVHVDGTPGHAAPELHELAALHNMLVCMASGELDRLAAAYAEIPAPAFTVHDALVEAAEQVQRAVLALRDARKIAPGQEMLPGMEDQ